jgi:hypothetical protein
MEDFKVGDKVTRRSVGEITKVNLGCNYVAVKFDSGDVGFYSRQFFVANFQRAETPVQRETEDDAGV